MLMINKVVHHCALTTNVSLSVFLLHTNPHQKRGLLQKERGANSFFLDSFFRQGKTVLTVACLSLESPSIPLRLQENK